MNATTKKPSLLLSLLALAAAAVAQDAPQQIHGISTVGERGITVSVAEIMKHPNIVSPDKLIGPLIKNTEIEVDRSHLLSDPSAPAVSQWPPAPPQSHGDGKYGGSNPFSPQGIGTQWTGSSAGNLFPPDSYGAVGPTQVMVTTNSQVRVYDKNGNLGGLNVTLDSFFNSVRNGGTSDPRCTFDRLSQKWYVCCITVSSPFRIVLAVSSGPTITNTTSFTFFYVSRGTVLPDYPSLGVDANGVYIGENSFNGGASYSGTHVTVIQKSSVQGSGPIFSTLFTTATSSGEGPFAPRGVDNDDPSPANGYIIGASNIAYSRLDLIKVTGANTTSPTIGSSLLITVPSTYNPITPVPSSGQSIDALDDRVFHAQMHLNRKTGQRTLWCAHNIRVTNTGVGSSGGNRDGSRWYQIDPAPASPTLVQSGTAFDGASSGFDHFTIPSCAMSGQGHMAIGFTMTRSGQNIRIGAAGRLNGDTLGSTQAATLAYTSPAVYNPGISRWGDYSMTDVDPADDQTMWTIQEFGASSGTWGVRVIKLVAPAPSAVASLVPNTIAQGATVNITVNGSQALGSEYYDTDSGYPNRLAAALSGSGLTVNSITFSHSNPQTFTMNVTAAGGAATGARDLTVTNPDGQSVTGTGVLTVTSGGSTTETLAPNGNTINLGKVSSGDLSSLAADDGNALTVCKFIVPSQTSPIVRMTQTYTTTKPSPTAIELDVKAKLVNAGAFKIRGFQHNYSTSSDDQVIADTTLTLSYATYTGTASGTLTNYVGASNAMQTKVEIQQTGPSTVTAPCVSFEFINLKVTG